MLRTYLVKSSFVSPLQGCPEGFNPVSVSLILYELPDTVIHRFVVRKSRVASVIVSVNLRLGSNVPLDKTLYGFLVPVRYPFGNNLV